MRPCSQGVIQLPSLLQRLRRPFLQVAQALLPTEHGHLRSRDFASPVPQRRLSIFRKLLALPRRHAAVSGQSRHNNTWPTILRETRRFARPASFRPPLTRLDIFAPTGTPHTESR